VAVVAVEFAVLLPFLAGLATGAFEIGRAIMVRQVLTDAARKGCRTGAWPDADSTAVVNDVNNILTDNGLNPSDATITIQVNGATANANTAHRNDQLSVKVAIPYAKAAWTPLFFLTASSIESETLTMMRQG
jgi:Flp pilus assembly protein TadG